MSIALVEARSQCCIYVQLELLGDKKGHHLLFESVVKLCLCIM